jgi:hypothetical protein
VQGLTPAEQGLALEPSQAGLEQPQAPGKEAGASPSPTTIPNSENNYQGDRVTFAVDVPFTEIPGSGAPKQNQCLKAGHQA